MASASKSPVSPSRQLWWFVLELSTTEFHQNRLYTQDVLDQGMNARKFLSHAAGRAKVDPKSPGEWQYWIHSKSMSAAVQILKDDAFKVMYQLYCRYDEVVTLYIRPSEAPSPNTSRAVSHAHSFAERRTASGNRAISEVVVRPPSRHISKDLDVVSGEPIKDLPAEDKVILDLGGGKYETFSKQYLLGWINAQASAGKDITDINVQNLTPNRRPKETALTSEVWMKSLLRGDHKADFQAIWDTYKPRIAERSEGLAYLEHIPGFIEKSRLFIRDLKTFGNDSEAQSRLHGTRDEFYLGEPYFDRDTVKRILKLPYAQGTVREALEALVRRKKDREEGDELCASHDLAPLFEAALNINLKKLDKDSILADFHNLTLGEPSSSTRTILKRTKELRKKASNVFGKGKENR